MIKAVLFDLDGTLVNSLEDLANATNFALSSMGFPCRELGEYNYLVGDGIPKLIERALPEGAKTPENSKKCLDIFMAYYREHYHDKTYAYKGVKELISDLKQNDLKTAVVSNKAQEMAQKVAEKLFGNMFDAVAGKREGFAAKPDPALTLEIVRELGVKPDDCALIGDSGMDMAAAVNGGLLPIGVLWGFRTKEELINNGAAYTVSSPDEILNIINLKNGRKK